jgi:hypothetical protein
MFGCLSGDTDTFDDTDGMIQLRSVLLVPAIDGTAAVWHPPVRCAHKLHGGGIEGKQVVAPGVLQLRATIGHTAGVGEVWGDLARVDGAVEDGGTYEHGKTWVEVRAGWMTGARRGWEGRRGG